VLGIFTENATFEVINENIIRNDGAGNTRKREGEKWGSFSINHAHVYITYTVLSIFAKTTKQKIQTFIGN
jgi:hypothetical protein